MCSNIYISIYRWYFWRIEKKNIDRDSSSLAVSERYTFQVSGITFLSNISESLRDKQSLLFGLYDPIPLSLYLRDTSWNERNDKKKKREKMGRECGYLTLSDKRNKAKGVIAVEIDFSPFS